MYLWSIKMERSVVNYAYAGVFDYHVAYYDCLPMFKKVKAVPGTRMRRSVTYLLMRSVTRLLMRSMTY